jgi:ATP-dependent RNA helicase RhlE
MAITELSGFAAFGLNPQLLRAVGSLGWKEPTPVQVQAIPPIRAGKDVLGIAQTGTGKSAAFLLPLMTKLHYPQGIHTRAVVLAPTKELVRQLFLHFSELNPEIHLRGLALVGGIGLEKQMSELRAGNDLVFATPGRFLEIYQTGEWKVKEIRTLVIDEADRMMDMGFMPQIRKILEKIPVKRQNLLFSATFPEKVEHLAAEFLEFPVRIETTPQATPAETITQAVFKTPNFHTKLGLLLHLLHHLPEDEAALVFVKTKSHATEIGRYLGRKLPFSVSFLHANKGTHTRSNAVDALHRGEIRVLVATDLAARGLDVSRITRVINFDMPVQYEDYVHRIGRTGRAARAGTAISFVHPPDELHLKRIEEMIRMKIPVLPLPDGVEVQFTPEEEKKEMLRKLDDQRKKADPSFKGAFHEKKTKNAARAKTGKGPAGKAHRKTGPAKAGTRPANRPKPRR